MFCLQEIAALDLYCGCGGLSFIDGVYAEDGVEIQTKWAVDYNESCCYSFLANYPDAQVRLAATLCNPAAGLHA
jgi:site-specific DNA-cytosine methylase